MRNLGLEPELMGELHELLGPDALTEAAVDAWDRELRTRLARPAPVVVELDSD